MSDSRHYNRQRAVTRRKDREHAKLRPRRPVTNLESEILDGEIEYADVVTDRGLDYHASQYLHVWDAKARVHRRPRRKELPPLDVESWAFDASRRISFKSVVVNVFICMRCRGTGSYGAWNITHGSPCV